MPQPSPEARQQAARLRTRLSWYNAVPNLLWSGLGFAPVVVFCYRHMALPWLYGLIGASLLVYLVPAALLRRLHLGQTPARYQRLGVPSLNHFTQHGTWVNALVRRRFPGYRHVSGRASAARLLRASYQLERFHWCVLFFFLLASFYALLRGYPGWALLISGSNVLYNLYPIWLQQYLRLRLQRFGPRR